MHPMTAPFNDPEADIIIRTSDSVEFRVYSVLLRISSPFFKSMLSLPQPPPSPDNGGSHDGNTPIIPVTESSLIIEPMLRFCYPFGDPKITRFSDIVGIVDAMRKYELVQLERAVELLHGEEVLAEKPFQVFAIACRLKLEEHVRKAAFYTLRHPLPVTVPEEFSFIGAVHLYQLLLYRKECVKAARARLETLAWSPSQSWFTCKSYCPISSSPVKVFDAGQTRTLMPRKWFSDFLASKSMYNLVGDQPWPNIFLGQITPSLIAAARPYDRKNSECECTLHATAQWEAFVRSEMVKHFEPALRAVSHYSPFFFVLLIAPSGDVEYFTMSN
jgi:hypothetical protein